MSRYRKSSRKLSELDPKSPEYWEEILKREDLNMSRGLNARRLVYVGNSNAVDKIAGLIETDDGRVTPDGAGPDE